MLIRNVCVWIRLPLENVLFRPIACCCVHVVCAETHAAAETTAVLLAAFQLSVTKQGKPAVASLASSPRLRCLLSAQRFKFESPAHFTQRVAVLTAFLDHPATFAETVSNAALRSTDGYLVQSNLMSLLANASAYFDKEWVPAKVCACVRPYVCVCMRACV
jgi:hypothetical protein